MEVEPRSVGQIVRSLRCWCLHGGRSSTYSIWLFGTVDSCACGVLDNMVVINLLLITSLAYVVSTVADFPMYVSLAFVLFNVHAMLVASFPFFFQC